MKFETLLKSKALNSMVAKFLVILEACKYWHLAMLAPVIFEVTVFWTKNGKSSNFDETLYFAQTEGGEFNGGNSFL